MVKRLWEWSIVQAESLSETGIVSGLLAAPLLGVVTREDADSAVVVDLARTILGNPYEDAEDGGDAPSAPPAVDGERTDVGDGTTGTHPVDEGSREGTGDGAGVGPVADGAAGVGPVADESGSSTPEGSERA